MNALSGKRLFDLVVCTVAVPLALPVCLVLAVIIRADSRGSPIFVQRRVGRGQREFSMLKLRTMKVSTGDHPSHEVGNAQITRAGRMLRRLKLDELPQLINVITGSMSLVGPRPCMPSQTQLIAERQDRGVFAYRPGLTGPAQLLGVDMSEPARLAEIEAEYFHRAGLADDILLGIRTVLGRGFGDAAGNTGESRSVGCSPADRIN